MPAVPFIPSLARRTALAAMLIAAASSVAWAATPALEDGTLQESLTRSLSAQASAEIALEAESYTWSYDAGGARVFITTCDTSASGGKVVGGLDYPGDWIWIEVTAREPMVFKHLLRVAAETGLRAKYVIEYLPMGPGPPASLKDTLVAPPGKGAAT